MPQRMALLFIHLGVQGVGGDHPLGRPRPQRNRLQEGSQGPKALQCSHSYNPGSN